ncbi:MAG: LpqB family beta-propeller domain-containing protein [Marmoricola sp.]
MTGVGRRLTGLSVLVVLCALLAGCSLLPESGPVVQRVGEGQVAAAEPQYVEPPGPVRGADREQVVRGFLEAMQANPLTTATARLFLSDQARQTWRPDGGTVVYDALTVSPAGSGTIAARLSDAHLLDASGRWSPRPTRTRVTRFHLVREHHEWRIDNPGNLLMVRSVYFTETFGSYDLYFFDRTARTLVADPVYVPSGPQAASDLVRGLLAGPQPPLAAVTRSAFPAGSVLDPSVVVTDSGVAEVPLGPEVLKMAPEELNRAMAQLAWTLRPVPGIRRVRITVAGTPVPLPDGRTDLGVDEDEEYGPFGLGSTRELVAVRSGRVVTVAGDSVTPVAGGLGRPGFALRSVALDRAGTQVAAVSENGTTAYLAATEPGSGRVTRPLSGADDLLRPSFDLFGVLWLVDRTPTGAVVRVVSNGEARVVRIPGVTGEPVTSFAISPDGTRLAVGIADPLRPRVTVVEVARGAAGAVQGGLAPRMLPVALSDPVHELGPVTDVGWRTPTLLAVLTRPDDTTSRVVYVPIDGSPGLSVPPLPDPLPGLAKALVVNADSGLPLLLLDDRGRLERLDGAGKWADTGSVRLTAAAYTD